MGNMDRVGVRQGHGRTPSGAWIPRGTGSSSRPPDGESAAYDSRIQKNMDDRVKEADNAGSQAEAKKPDLNVKSKARRRALGRMG